MLESEAGLFYSSPEFTVVPLYGNECVNGSTMVVSLHSGCPCNYYNLSIYDQLFYSVPEIQPMEHMAL